MVDVLIFGDSIAWGSWDIEGGWVQRLKRVYGFGNTRDIKSMNLIYNLGVPGDTSDFILERFENEVKARFNEFGVELVIVFNFGGNDATFVSSKNSTRVSEQTFKLNLKKLVKIARKFAKKIVFVGMLPVDESKTNPIYWNADFYLKNEFIKIYDDIMKNVCKTEKIHFVDIFAYMQKVDYKDLLEDGVHPKSSGHEMMCNIIKAYLEKKKIIKFRKF